jgi:hypothetical protein
MHHKFGPSHPTDPLINAAGAVLIIEQTYNQASNEVLKMRSELCKAIQTTRNRFCGVFFSILVFIAHDHPR